MRVPELFGMESGGNPETRIHRALTVRIPSFVIRAMLAGNWHHAAENLGLVVADQVLFGVGFFGLLYSAYILILDRCVLAFSMIPRHCEPLSIIPYPDIIHVAMPASSPQDTPHHRHTYHTRSGATGHFSASYFPPPYSSASSERA